MKLSKRSQYLTPSPTLAMAARTQELRTRGVDIVSLTLGEPDWPTFAPALKAGIQAIDEGFTRYTAPSGTPELREIIARTTSEHLALGRASFSSRSSDESPISSNHKPPLSFSPDQVAVGTGAKFLIFASLQLLLDPGDEVILPSPYWVSYPTMIHLAGGIPYVVNCTESSGFKLNPQDLKKALREKTKAIILCSPSNPTGVVYDHEELKKIGSILQDYPQVSILSDDIYNRLLLSSDRKTAPHILEVCPQLEDRTLLINGASKTFSMTGWRIGWALGPESFIHPLGDYLSQSTSSPCSFSQKAVVQALKTCDTNIIEARAVLTTRYNWLFEGLKRIPGFHPIPAQGTFYIWVGVEALFSKKIPDSRSLCEVLLNKYQVAAIPGVDFGGEGFIRISFATDMNSLNKALDRLNQFAVAERGKQ